MITPARTSFLCGHGLFFFASSGGQFCCVAPPWLEFRISGRGNLIVVHKITWHCFGPLGTIFVRCRLTDTLVYASAPVWRTVEVSFDLRRLSLNLWSFAHNPAAVALMFSLFFRGRRPQLRQPCRRDPTHSPTWVWEQCKGDALLSRSAVPRGTGVHMSLLGTTSY